MSIVVYYLPALGETPKSIEYADGEMSVALARCQELRGMGYIHVTMSSHLEGQVGGMGVSSVVDGKLPDGEDYKWSKAHRAGAKPQK